MDSKKIGLCMKRNREKYQMSLSDLSEKTGMEVSVLKSYEAGTQKLRARELTLISKAINVPLCLLIRGGGQAQILSRDENGRAVWSWYDY